ncbi:MAG: GDP-mannose 4,6-dehydratase [Candidatus Yonathbacteria bacterium]|nr:GDP-mannose 4,6-dehydratase [Candidatus Yonathbacteria bacterium]
MKNNILITGSAGFMGLGLTSRLLELNDNKDRKIVLLYHHDKPTSHLYEPCIVFVKGDLNDHTSLCDIISKYEINTIYHFASDSILKRCFDNPINAYEVNVMGTVNLLEAVHKVGMETVKKIIVSTSSKVYGDVSAPYDEKTLLKPKYTYESTKACQDIVAQNYFSSYGLPINIVRCSNLYGPNDPNESRIIPTTIKTINRKEKPQVYSSVRDSIREFVFIDDLIDAILLIEEKANNGEIFCVGGPEAISINALVRKICLLMGYDGEIETVEKLAFFHESKDQSIDDSKLRNLGWNPKFTLDQGLLECIKSKAYK